MNHLQGQLSPYLLQHVDNPVDWYPWGDEAFAKARQEHKPILLSIGYSTCHWCHVMAHESFEDAEVADYLNRHFVAIKVDREERPDIDAIYMDVCQAMTGSGGWPLTIFMDVEAQPFLAATYLPKHGRYGRSGLMEVLAQIQHLWQHEPARLADTTGSVMRYLAEKPSYAPKDDVFTIERLAKDVALLRDRYDDHHGGFGLAPKFPQASQLFFLQRYGQLRDEEEALEMVRGTLRGMYRGGLFDHVGGGFARYSTDGRWLVPHFEKMLYDNAQLAVIYLRQYQIDGDALWLDVAERTLAYLLRDMRDAAGGFYSAQDADSAGVEGAYYVFTPAEVRVALPEDQAEALIAAYDVTEVGNFEGKNILNLLEQPTTAPPSALLQEALEGLRRYRSARMQLHTDDKVLLGWNALATVAFVTAYEVTGKVHYLETARAVRTFIDTQMKTAEGTYLVRYRQGRAGEHALLEDLAYLAWADMSFYRATGNSADLVKALALLEVIEADYRDPAGGYFMDAAAHATLIVRPKSWFDTAQMSGQAVLAHLFDEAYAYTANPTYQARFEALLAAYSGRKSLSALANGYLYAALLGVLLPRRELIITDPTDSAWASWQSLLRQYPLYNTTCLLLDATARSQLAPYADLFEAFPASEATAYYLCSDHACAQPVGHFAQLLPHLVPAQS